MRGKRWISSINKISPSCNEIKIPTMSRGCSSAGAEVILQFTPISDARIRAIVVLPNPGGPYKSKWSKDSWRTFAAWIAMSSTPLRSFWPIYSLILLGRRLSSWIFSSVVAISACNISESTDANWIGIADCLGVRFFFSLGGCWASAAGCLEEIIAISDGRWAISLIISINSRLTWNC